jgi:hypothetical protein
MRIFQDLFDKAFRDALSFPEFAAHLISKGMLEQDIELSQAQREHISDLLGEMMDQGILRDNLQLTVSDEGEIGISSSAAEKQLEIDLNELADLEIARILEGLPDTMTSLADEISNILLDEIKAQSDEILKSNKKDLKEFQKNLHRKREELLSLFEIYITITEEIGAEYNHYIRTNSENGASVQFEVLSRLHARGCQVAKEILILLKHGFADGAHARWRTLHELSVDANLINRFDDSLAQKYVDHDIVQRYKSAKTYQQHCEQIGFEPLPEDKLSQLKASYNHLITKYGKVFSNDNGWASEITRKTKPNFYDLESAVDLSHIHPFYKLANLNVHSGPRGLFLRLGLTPEQHDETLLSGSSVFGLDDPIQNTAYSLMLLTANLLTHEVNLDCLIALCILMKLEGEIFDAVQQINL